MDNYESYPKNAYEALTMLYLSKADTSNLTPSQLVDRYNEIYAEIKRHYLDTEQKRH